MWQTEAVLLTRFFACSAPPPPPLPAPAQQLLPVDPVDHRDWEDYGFDQDVPVSPRYQHCAGSAVEGSAGH